MNFLLKVWRQANPKTKGKVNYEATNISPNTSFLEMLDVVNEQLVECGEEPILLTQIAGRASAACAR